MKFVFYWSVLLGLILLASEACALGMEDPIESWLDNPNKHDPQLHLAFVEVVSIADEHHTVREDPFTKVSYDGGKTWHNVLEVYSGMATLKVIESPGIEMPTTNTVYFESPHWVAMPDRPWTDWKVHSGDLRLGLFTQKDGKWYLENFFLYDPLDLFMNSNYASRIQARFRTQLSDDKALAERKRMYEKAAIRAGQQEVTNHIEGK